MGMNENVNEATVLTVFIKDNAPICLI